MSEQSDEKVVSMIKREEVQADTATGEDGMEKEVSVTQEEGEGVDEDGDGVMRGAQLAAFTLGMMVVMFLMCLDHYILGM
jgi:hypothetical protein